MLSFDEVVRLARARATPLLVGIDGLSLAGKSTLAECLAANLSAQVISLDEFVKPEAQWASHNEPSYPFDFILYPEFMSAVRSLAVEGACTYHPYDWDTGGPTKDAKTVTLSGVVVVEGVTALHPDLSPLYDLRVWVESDAESTLAASIERGVGSWRDEWENMFLPSVALYLRTDPKARADLIAAGRGVEKRRLG